MIAAAVQYSPPKGDPERAREEMLFFVDEAAERGAGLIVFPEMSTSGYIWKSREELLPFAEKSFGNTFRAFSPAAKSSGTWIIIGYPEVDNGTLYNSALIISPDGQLCANYRKVLLYDSDTSWAMPGNTRFIIDTPFGTMSPAICMDMNDDGFIDFITSRQPKIIPFCTNWLEEGLDVHYYWKERLNSYTGYLIAANRWGEDCGTHFCGNSAIISPDKRIIAQAQKNGNCVITAELIL
jgi:predicted amidohydrolase